MSLDTKERNDIILGAVNMTGPVGDDTSDWNSRLRTNVLKLSVMLSESSKEARLIEMLQGCKVFSATLLYVAKEPSSKRGFVGLKTKPSNFAKDGIENVRTEITENNPVATRFCQELRELHGHRVLLWVEMQASEDGSRKFRVLQHVEDLGLDPDYVAEDAKAITLARMRNR